MKQRRWTGLLAALALVLTLIPAAEAAAPAPAVSTNKGAHEYINGRRWAQPIRSYLYENPAGGLTRVEYTGDEVVVEDYTASFVLRTSRSIQPELPLWGGFFAGEEYNYLLFGQDNREEDDSREVLRVVQYDKQWNRLGQASLCGANTVEPFSFGCPRFAEYGGWLYIRACHEMYASRNGINHQANLMVALRQKDMEITDAYYEIMNADYGYVSHSFSQFILVDQEGRIVALDHGDAAPTRSAVLLRYRAGAGQDSFRDDTWVPVGNGYYSVKWADWVSVQEFPAAAHYNDTGCALGGFAETGQGYVTAYQFDGAASELGTGRRDVYLAFADKELNVSEPARVSGGQKDVSNPQLVSTGPEGGYVLWNGLEQTGWYSSALESPLYYAAYDARGQVGEVRSAEGFLSDCAPIVWNGKVVWYTTDRSAPVFYTLDGSGVTASQARAADPTAHAAPLSILVDGERVELQAYALWDKEGNPTNYVRLRDLAYVLNGTPAQFQVEWNNQVILTAGTPYTPNGEEMTTPYSGDQPYAFVDGPAGVNGQGVWLDAFAIYDSAGGGYTYYKLRDLGAALGFAVDWDSQLGVVVSTARN